MDRGAWWAVVRGVTKSWTPLKQLSMHAFIPETITSQGFGQKQRGSLRCLPPLEVENPMDRGAWWATVHGVTKSQTRQVPGGSGQAGGFLLCWPREA